MDLKDFSNLKDFPKKQKYKIFLKYSKASHRSFRHLASYQNGVQHGAQLTIDFLVS